MNHASQANQHVVMIMHIVIIAQGLVMIAAQIFRIVRGEQSLRIAKRTETIVTNGHEKEIDRAEGKE